MLDMTPDKYNRNFITKTKGYEKPGYKVTKTELEVRISVTNFCVSLGKCTWYINKGVSGKIVLRLLESHHMIFNYIITNLSPNKFLILPVQGDFPRKSICSK